MEGHLQQQNSPRLGYPIDGDDVKYLSGLSTILVATIQEAKDRISQIEYIFCSQLYPNFQSRSKDLQKVYSEARKAADDAWKKKENVLQLQIEQLQLEKQQILEENESIRLKKAEPSKEQEEKTNLLLAKQNYLEKQVSKLELELRRKSKEVDEGLELQNKLLQLVQSKDTLIVSKGKQLKEHEEETKVLLAKLKSSEKNADELQKQLEGKTEEAAKGKELREELLNKIELQASKIMDNERLLNDHEKEEKLLRAKLEHLEENVDGLQEQLRKKADELEEGRKLQGKLLQQVDLNRSEMLRKGQQLGEHVKEKQLLLDKLKGLEEKVDELQADLTARNSEISKRKELVEDLIQDIRSKTSELESEKNKRRDVIAAYKRLKSQYNFLCAKFGLTMENTLPQNKIEDGSNSLGHFQDPMPSPDHENRSPETSAVACGTTKEKNEISLQEKLDSKKGVGLVQTSRPSPPISSSPNALKCPTEIKSAPLAGSKRPASHWRDTRSRQCQEGLDPHDDFLDTPFENVRGNLNKAMKEEVHDLPGPVPKDMNFDSSDDETQDLNVASSPQKQQMPVPRAAASGYKYVEPVRKKAERENLKGVECKQCRKFYDAVLPGGDGKDTDGNKRNFRCEHHDGVSRHRYRYVPPMTPEGFWNIGFDSEM